MIQDMILNLFNNNNNVIDISYNKFILPIEYLNDKIYISDSIKNDLELDNKYIDIVNNKTSNNDINTDEISNNIIDNSYHEITSLYKYVFNPQTHLENNQLNKWSKYYTNNKSFLLDTQYLLSNYSKIETQNINEISCLLYTYPSQRDS